MKVKILRASLPTYWYADKVGEVFEVEDELDNGYTLKGMRSYYIRARDCEVISESQPAYTSLSSVLNEALQQASNGKGKDRHAENNEPFERQIICEVRRRVGSGYTLGQATKKIYESQRLEGERGIAELLGAINYLAAEIIVRRENG